ncbi:aspartate dehydrogenase [Aciduliprofundum sp. MAR08-339]|uniref:aspartate dehydrogenase n=1 Tax=Aciduliprofundum sp. (strain MAR08-339) TaxID=673860 RepID=UPI0002A49BF6|nr:aspartate dehydrogenase [Aciduliprofundum sp. MAR08-339]
MKIGIIGCGAIAHEIAKHRDDVAALYDMDCNKCKDLPGFLCKDIDSLISRSDLIIEAASPSAVKEYAEKIIEAGKDLLIMSVGGLADDDFRAKIFRMAREMGVRIYLPAGAIGGIDIIRSARMAGIRKAKIMSTKNSKTLGVDCKERTLVFKGSAKEAIKRFPKSTNVTVLLSIATGVDVEVEVYADPKAERNTHEIHLEGEFGEAVIRVSNNPSKSNPRTSYLAALSPLEVLDLINSPVWVGV